MPAGTLKAADEQSIVRFMEERQNVDELGDLVVLGMFASTVLVLLVIPCLYVILDDFGLRAANGDEEEQQIAAGIDAFQQPFVSG